jgi:hypothetical protein
MAPAAVEMIGKKKRRREKRDETSTSLPGPDVYIPKQRKRRSQRDDSQAPGAHPSLSFYFKLQFTSV